MLNEIFILAVFITLAFVFQWAFKTLPEEKWQIIGCFPYLKLPNGHWKAWNLTWYGFFNATAISFAACILLILLGALSTPLMVTFPILFLILLICLPASRIMALLIENKHNMSSVGGASFVGIIIAPYIVVPVKFAAYRWFGFNISVIGLLSAMSTAYAFGESVGRLACISYGCCYGKPLKELSPFFQKIFHRYHFIFTGKTKKIAYAHSLDGQQVIPVQAMTTLIYSIAGIAGCYLFLNGFTAVAFILTLMITQGWRFLSEFLRADYRGEGKISVYQIMALFSCLYGLLIAYLFHEPQLPKAPDLVSGLSSLWNPVVLLLLIASWMLTFFYTGKSKVTTALIDIHVCEEKI